MDWCIRQSRKLWPGSSRTGRCGPKVDLLPQSGYAGRPLSFVERIRQRAATLKRRIVFPESGDDRVISAASEIARDGMAVPILVVDGRPLAEAAARAGLRSIQAEKGSALEFAHRLVA